MLELLYSTGLRSAELCWLSVYDLDLSARTLRVLWGKGKKDRVVPVGKVAASYVSEYIKRVRVILSNEKHPSSLLFLSARGRCLRSEDLSRLLRRYRDQAHLPDSITVHSLRHTCATVMLKGGASIRHVQELLGHASIQTTQIYTHVVQTDLQKAHARSAPSERRQRVEVPRFDDEHPSWNDNRNAKYWPNVRGPEAKKKARKEEKSPRKNDSKRVE